MRSQTPTTAVIGAEPGAAGAGGPRGLVRLHPWSDDLAPSVLVIDGPVSIGRDDGGPVFLEDSISRRHAEVRPAGLFVEVVDHGSRNGTFVREERVVGPRFAGPGELVRFGRTVYLVVADASACDDWWRRGLDGPLVGGAAMRQVRALAARFAASEDPVLLAGETGTGKEILAAEIHRASGRAGPFVAVNCAAVPPSIFESQFFGHRRGAFTGAERDEPGFFRAAQDGTILLDEVGEIDPAAQAKLLRVLETRQVIPLGNTRPEDVRVRVLAATNRDLAAAVADGSFRADLYARLRVLGITLPPLRERVEDVALLACRFLEGLDVRGIGHEAIVSLAAYAWPGNARELRNTLVEAAGRARAAGRDEITRADLRPEIVGPPREAAPAVADRRVADVLAAMREHDGNVARAARALGLHRAQVYTALRAARRAPADFRTSADAAAPAPRTDGRSGRRRA